VLLAVSGQLDLLQALLLVQLLLCLVGLLGSLGVLPGGYDPVVVNAAGLFNVFMNETTT
jgi:hypothetical protein